VRHETIFISGVSSGFGLAAARVFLAAGYRVAGISRTAPADPRIDWRAADVRDGTATRAAAAELFDRCDCLAAVICSAGQGIVGPTEEIPPDDARAVFDTNYFGTVNVINAMLPVLRSQCHGRIVLLGSLAAHVPLPFQAHYSASKAAIGNFALALSAELRNWGIGVTVVEPDDVQTSFLKNCVTTRQADSPYAAELERCMVQIRADMAAAPGPGQVADALLRIVQQRRPPVRRLLGRNAFLVSLSRRLFPDWLSLTLIRRHFRLDTTNER
jgi:NAD(P)-dependent dehydrogenase (short-subunit alcohol dehydrogenase family)